jgi:hypothetical protein
VHRDQPLPPADRGLFSQFGLAFFARPEAAEMASGRQINAVAGALFAFFAL